MLLVAEMCFGHKQHISLLLNARIQFWAATTKCEKREKPNRLTCFPCSSRVCGCSITEASLIRNEPSAVSEASLAADNNKMPSLSCLCLDVYKSSITEHLPEEIRLFFVYDDVFFRLHAAVHVAFDVMIDTLHCRTTCTSSHSINMS